MQPLTQALPAGDADPGLELTTFVSGVDAHTLAATLAPYADQPVPIARDLEDLWAAYGFRIISIPIEQVQPTVASLQTAGGGGSTQRQWLGQAYSWTEVVRAGRSSGQVIALDAERIRLAPGSLRLLVRSWIEPIPPQVSVGEVSGGQGPNTTAPGATLRVEMVPQNRESRTPEQALDPLAINEPRLEAESQGLLFSRLYTRMSLAPGRALVIVPDRPEADWRRLAAEPAAASSPAPSVSSASTPSQHLDDADAVAWIAKPKPVAADVPAASIPSDKSAPPPPAKTGPPKLGEVVRAGPRPVDPAPPRPTDQPAVEVGPAPARVPTLGEAMLMGDSSPFPSGSNRRSAPAQRVVLVLVPRVPKEFRLLGPAAPAAPVAPATPSEGRPQPG